MKLKTAIIIAATPLILLLVFCCLIMFSDICWYAAEAKGLNPREMVRLTTEEKTAFGSIAGDGSDPHPLVSVSFREHFRCHTLEKPSNLADYWRLITVTIRVSFSNISGGK